MSKGYEHSIKVPRLYKCAAKVVKQSKEGGCVNYLVYKTNHSNVKGLYALVMETIKHDSVLDFIIELSGIMGKETKCDIWLAKVLITELLWRKQKLPGPSKPVKTILAYQSQLQRALKEYEKESTHFPENSIEVKCPRYVRVNTLFISVEDAIKHFQREGWNFEKFSQESYKIFQRTVCRLTKGNFMNDFHLEELLIFPPKTDFHNHELYQTGAIILQDKASCLAARVLDPKPDSIVLDMCAAPGMKATYLASLMNNTGTIHAVDKDKNRFVTLLECINHHCGPNSCVKPKLTDALDVSSQDCPEVQYILVDPSCSTTGMTNLKVSAEELVENGRVKRLASFQEKLLYHALTDFPKVQRVVYSTCSVLPEENEEVVYRVLQDVKDFQIVESIMDKWIRRGKEEYDFGKFCLRTDPKEDLTAGFFIAVFERTIGDRSQDSKNARRFNKSKKRRQKKFTRKTE